MASEVTTHGTGSIEVRIIVIILITISMSKTIPNSLSCCCIGCPVSMVKVGLKQQCNADCLLL